MARKIEGAALDLEGTIVDVERAHYLGFLEVARFLGLEDRGFTEDPISFEERIPGSIGAGDPKNIEWLLQMAGREVDYDMIETFRLLKMDVYKRALSTIDIAPRPWSDVVVRLIKGSGIPAAICSLTPADQATVIFERSGVNAWFPPNHIVLREDVMRRKPYSDAYVMTAIKTGVPTDKQLVIEDSLNGVRAAVAASKVKLDPVDPDNRTVIENSESFVIAIPTELAQESPTYVDDLYEAGAMRVFKSWEDPGLIPLIMELTEA